RAQRPPDHDQRVRQRVPIAAHARSDADKWAVLVIASIHEGVNRNGAMLRRIDGISQKMLTQTVRRLERDGLVSRIAFNEIPPRVEYGLTPIAVRASGRSSSRYANGRSPTSRP